MTIDNNNNINTDDNKVFNPKYWFITIVGFIIFIVILSDIWVYREFYNNQKSALEDIVDAIGGEINYKITTTENLLMNANKGLLTKQLSKLSDDAIIRELKIPKDILKNITKIKITPEYIENQDTRLTAVRLQEYENNLYFIVSNGFSNLNNKKTIEVYLDIKELASKYLYLGNQKNKNHSFEIEFLFKDTAGLYSWLYSINYLSYTKKQDNQFNKIKKLKKLDDIELYKLLEEEVEAKNNSLKLSKTNFILGNPNWQIKGYIKQQAIKDFVKILIFVSLFFILIILFVSNLAYRRLCKLEDVNLRAILAKNKAEAKMNYLAYYDGLTNLPNKASLIKRFESFLSRELFFKTEAFKLFTIVINIPLLKEVNDSIGYQYGDNVLLGFSKLVNDFLGLQNINQNIFFRSGGNTFVLSIIYDKQKHGKSHILYITNFINNLFKELTKPIKIKEEDLYFSYYAGVSIYPDDFKNLTVENNELLLRYAEIAMSAARKKGLNKYIFYSEDLGSSMLMVFNLENELKRALANNKLELLLQPQAELKTKKLRGFEALVRWQKENGHIESPSTFIPILEKSGLIVTVGDWILREACIYGIELIRQGIKFECLSVNISALQLQSENFIQRMIDILNITGFPHQKLEIEVTESILVEVPDKIIKVLNQIKDLGIKIALDDFGTGFSSLSYLKILPIDYLKVDRAFIKDLDSPEDSKLLLAILAIAKSMGLYSIVEGVESQEQVDFLRDTTCDIIQGYYVNKALSISEVIKLYSNKKEVI